MAGARSRSNLISRPLESLAAWSAGARSSIRSCGRISSSSDASAIASATEKSITFSTVCARSCALAFMRSIICLWRSSKSFAQFVAQDVEVAEDRLHRRAKFVREIGQRLHVKALLPLRRRHSRAGFRLWRPTERMRCAGDHYLPDSTIAFFRCLAGFATQPIFSASYARQLPSHVAAKAGEGESENHLDQWGKVPRSGGKSTYVNQQQCELFE